MVFLWLKLFFIALICFDCNANPIPNQETEFECVSIHKQSVLQHPHMKNHQIQTKPSRELLALLSRSHHHDTNTKFGLEECPEGQVPIHKPKFNITNNIHHRQHVRKRGGRLLKQAPQETNNLRTQKVDELINFGAFSSKYKRPNRPPKLIIESSEHYAIIREFENTTKRWRGAQALFNINKPKVSQNQYSKTWIWLSYIKGNIMSTIQFGVAVHTKLYRDDRPRLTTYWKSETQQEGCYNSNCPGGYIQIHRSIYPGMPYNQFTVPGGPQHTVQLSVAEDPVTKNWILTTGLTMIGYWPHQTYMSGGASEIYFGGYAGTSLPQTINPPMGTGEFPTKDLSRSHFMKRLKYVLPDYTVADINSNEVEYYNDAPKCYGVMFLKYVDFDSRETLTFGGPGGNCFN